MTGALIVAWLVATPMLCLAFYIRGRGAGAAAMRRTYEPPALRCKIVTSPPAIDCGDRGAVLVASEPVTASAPGGAVAVSGAAVAAVHR